MKIDVKVVKNKIVLNYNLKKDETYKINDKDKIFSLSIYKKPQLVKGITSLCEDGNHILMLDYDNVCRWIVEAEITELAEHHNFFLFKTKEEIIQGELVGNYHAICIEKFCVSEIVDIQTRTSCDRAYTTMPLRNRYRSWVLRLSDKYGSGRPEYIKSFISNLCVRSASLAHYTVLKGLYPNLKYPAYTLLDNSKKVYLNEYETG